MTRTVKTLVWLIGAMFSILAHSASERIVTIDGSVTEIVAELGSSDDIVGVDSTSIWHPAVHGKAVVGYMRALSSEGLLSLNPSMIITTDDAGPQEVLDQVARASVDVQVIENDYSAQGVKEKVATIGDLLNKPDQAERLVDEIQNDFKTVEQNIQQYGKRYRVMFVMDSGERGLMVAGRGTRAQGVLDMAGLDNVFADIEGYKSLTPEAAVMLNPDVVLVFHSQLPLAQLQQNAALRLTSAAQAGRIFNVDRLNLLNFGSSIGTSIIELQEWLMAQ